MKIFTDNVKLFSVPWGDWGTYFILGVSSPQVSRSPVWFHDGYGVSGLRPSPNSPEVPKSPCLDPSVRYQISALCGPSSSEVPSLSYWVNAPSWPLPLPEQPGDTREPRLDSWCQLSGQCTMWPPSLPEQSRGTREPRLAPSVSYRISAPCRVPPSQPRANLWSDQGALSTLVHYVLVISFSVHCVRAPITPWCNQWEVPVWTPFGPWCQLSGHVHCAGPLSFCPSSLEITIRAPFDGPGVSYPGQSHHVSFSRCSLSRT